MNAAVFAHTVNRFHAGLRPWRALCCAEDSTWNCRTATPTVPVDRARRWHRAPVILWWIYALAFTLHPVSPGSIPHRYQATGTNAEPRRRLRDVPWVSSRVPDASGLFIWRRRGSSENEHDHRRRSDRGSRFLLEKFGGGLAGYWFGAGGDVGWFLMVHRNPST